MSRADTPTASTRPRSASPTTSGRASSATSRSPRIAAVLPIDALVAALVPLYFGRVAAFVIETRELTTQQAETVVERQARAFELAKPASGVARSGGRRQ